MTDSRVYKRTRIIQDAHTDRLGHVNNTVWVDFIVELAAAHSEALGFDIETTRRIGGIWIVHRHEIDYHLPALPGEEILEETWLSSIRGARSIRHARFTRAEDATRLVSAVTHWAYVDAETQRPRRIHPEVLETFKKIEASERSD